jgi:glycosyltransferase involved in cell wall biosynthesis
VLYVGRIAEPKGLSELVEAVRLASLSKPGIVCLMVGSYPAFDETEKLQQQFMKMRDLRDKIRILPGCSPDKVWDYFYSSDIFAFPSHHEGMPNSLLEAMAAGLPAIAYGIPPVLEIDDGKAVLKIVPPFDVIGFSEAILGLANSSEKRRMIGTKGQREIFARFMAHKNMEGALRRLIPLVERRGSSRIGLAGHDNPPSLA